ncbi:DUF4189 domain-containing protein [Xanthomonas campestris]|uniref:DUF4189 domain-containing protein n=2 Tax=Xanthomonas campestris TaxID=339 RepID=UPI0009D7288E|nr:DUF4189 domain-containing protein [Xanthomonas campestris]MEA9705875.1 DUF4189 domain-containing protein [Xanthomonas campestris pv. raphani]MEA9901824.1 DUF4189 domain-containing protein [Xanthomonas campestris pv. raphani]
MIINTCGNGMRRYLLIFLSLSATSAPFDGYAQTRCPIGTQMGNIQCIPDEPVAGSSESEPAKPLPDGEWIKTWGAIARASDNSVGATSGKPTKKDAEEEALRQCSTGGGINCKVELAYQNQCVSLANSTGGSGSGGIATGGSVREAEERALSKCGGGNKSGCEIVYSKCSLPEFNKF